MKINNVLLSHMSGFNIEIAYIKSIFEEYNLKYKIIHRRSMSKKILKNVDFIISLGGDGTFLRTSHSIYSKIPLFGINPDPFNKEGFFTRANIKDFKIKFEQIMKGKYKILPLTRLQAKINGRLIEDLSLNEFYFGRSTGHHMSKYTLRIGSKKEIQKSSGVLIGGAQSSCSWIGSAGGKILPLSSKNYQLIVREPYHGKLTKAKMLNLILKPTQKVNLQPLTSDFSLVVDSLREFRLSPNDKVEISISNKYLHFVTF